MDEQQMSEVLTQIPKPPDGSVFELDKVVKVTYPHPFMITAKHVARAADQYGGMLGEECLRGQGCGMRDCNLRYEEHKTEVALTIVVPRGSRDLNAIPGLHAYLLSIKEVATGLGIEGFAFPDRKGAL